MVCWFGFRSCLGLYDCVLCKVWVCVVCYMFGFGGLGRLSCRVRRLGLAVRLLLVTTQLCVD